MVGSRKTTKYYLPIENGLVGIGHGMCSGPFRFRGKKPYEIRLARVDQAGNESGQTKGIVFTPPIEHF